MPTTKQVAKIANVSEQTVRNYTRDYAPLFSTAARGENGTRLFSDEDVQVFCAIADLRKSGVPPAEVIERVRVGNVVIDVAPQNNPHEATQSPQTALEAPQMLMVVRSDLQRQINEIKRTQATLIRAGVLWGVVLGAIGALGVGAFVLWALWLLANNG